MYDLGKQFHNDSNNLKSRKEAILSGKNYRFTVLTERLIRLEYSIDGVFCDNATQLVVFRNFDIPKYESQEDQNYLEIKTKYFTLMYNKNMPFKGSAFKPMANLKVMLNDTDKIWYYGHPEARNYYGSNISVESNNTKNINKGLYSVDGFVSLDDSNSLKFDEVGTIIETKNNNLDIYLFMYKKDFGYAMQDYFKLTGNPSFVPRYVLGNWWCRNKSYTEEEVLSVVNDFEKSNIPISTFLFDATWHKNPKITGFSFNNDLIHTPTELISKLHSKGIRVGLNINPINGIKDDDESYQEVIKYLTPNKDGIVEFTPFNPRFLDTYFKIIIHPLEKIGVDFFWNDYNNVKDLKTLWILNHYHYKDLGRDPAKREMILSRNALIASHRYPVLYSGKTKVSWTNFKELPFYNISSSNIGVSWWSHDVGGYSGGIEEAELYVRSVQLGTFSPILRFHSDDGKFYKKEPWKWDLETKSIVTNYLDLRHKLISYLYSEAYRYYSEGKLIFQPLYYLFPKIYDDELYRNEYFFGSELLIAPIISKKEPIMDRTIHRFYLPEGVWYDYTTGKRFVGNTKYVAFFKDEDYPVFAKQGSIIPLSLKSNINNTSNPTDIEIQVFPGKNNTFILYEDDGISSLYKEGYFLKTSIDYNYLPNNYTLIIRSIEGKKGIVPNTRNYKIRFRNTKNAEDVIVRFGKDEIKSNNYIDGNDFIVEITNVSSVGQLTINCKGKDIEIEAMRLINEDIDSILVDLQLDTELKEKIDAVLFSNEPIKKKRIGIRKLKRYGLDKSFIKLFLNLLEYIEQI